MTKQKILHVIPTLDQSGAEKQLALLAHGLPRDRFDVSVCALTRGGHYQDRLESAGIPVHVLGKRLKFDPWTLSKLTRLIRSIQPDIVQTWMFAGNSYGRVAAHWAKAPVVIASERCVDSWKRNYQLRLDCWLAQWTDAIVVNSQAVRQFYEKAGIETGKLRVISNAVEPAQPAAPLDDRLAELKIRRDVPTIGFIGRLWPQKRVQDIIWAADILRLDGRQLQVLVIGDGPRRSALERFAYNLEIEDSMRFLGHRPDAADFLEAMDIVVLPSLFEGMPNTVLEAMQAGKPVVATRIAGMEEVVVDGVTGVLVPPKKPFDLAQAIVQLLDDPTRRAQMGQAGRQRASELFSVERMISQYVELYSSFAREGEAPAEPRR